MEQLIPLVKEPVFVIAAGLIVFVSVCLPLLIWHLIQHRRALRDETVMHLMLTLELAEEHSRRMWWLVFIGCMLLFGSILLMFVGPRLWEGFGGG